MAEHDNDNGDTGAVPRPLDGLSVTWDPGCGGYVPSTVRETVLRHVRALGADVEADADVSSGPPGLRLSGDGVAVTCSLSGDNRWHDTIAEAECGIMAVHARSEGEPTPLGLDYVSVLVATSMVQGTMAAALGRLRGGDVERVELDATQVGFLSVAQYLAAATAEEDPELIGTAEEQTRHRPPFRSSCGRIFELETLDPAPWQAFWTGLGASPEAAQRSWRPFMLRYAQARAPLDEELHEVVGRIDYARVVEMATRTGMSVCPVRSLAERREDPALWPAAEGVDPWLLTSNGEVAPPTAPRAVAAGLPLEGVRVVESTRRVQGPAATRLLTLLGADVVRIEPPEGDPLRWMPPMAGDCSARFTALNHGKRCSEIDFKDTRGRADVLDLVRDADAFLHNWAPRKAASLLLDADHLWEVNPALVYAYASGWGSALGEHPPLGTDFMVQAYSGVADALGSPARRAKPSLVTLLDMLGGFVTAEGILAGLLARHRNGSGVRVDTSLLSASTTLLADRLAPEGLADPPAPAAPPVPPAAVDGVFETSRGRLAVAAPDTDTVRRLSFVTGAPVHRAGSGDRLLAELATALRARSAEEWATELRTAGVPAAVVREELDELPRSGAFADRFEHHGCAVPVSPWRFS